ncbi:hypothetical protein HK102_011351, partial [Quaeritorhiza haematococci]
DDALAPVEHREQGASRLLGPLGAEDARVVGEVQDDRVIAVEGPLGAADGLLVHPDLEPAGRLERGAELFGAGPPVVHIVAGEDQHLDLLRVPAGRREARGLGGSGREQHDQRQRREDLHGRPREDGPRFGMTGRRAVPGSSCGGAHRLAPALEGPGSIISRLRPKASPSPTAGDGEEPRLAGRGGEPACAYGRDGHREAAARPRAEGFVVDHELVARPWGGATVAIDEDEGAVGVRSRALGRASRLGAPPFVDVAKQPPRTHPGVLFQRRLQEDPL